MEGRGRTYLMVSRTLVREAGESLHLTCAVMTLIPAPSAFPDWLSREMNPAVWYHATRSSSFSYSVSSLTVAW